MGAFPGSLPEGAGSPQGLTEGVSSDGCSMPTIHTPAHINSEIFERLRASKYTPSVSHSLDSSLREGAGGYTIQRTAQKAQGCGRFSSPLRKLRGGDISPFNGRHSLSLAFARQLPQRGSREGREPFNRVLAKIRGRGRFSSPLRSSGVFTVCHSVYRPETAMLWAVVCSGYFERLTNSPKWSILPA